MTAAEGGQPRPREVASPARAVGPIDAQPAPSPLVVVETASHPLVAVIPAAAPTSAAAPASGSSMDILEPSTAPEGSRKAPLPTRRGRGKQRRDTSLGCGGAIAPAEPPAQMQAMLLGMICPEGPARSLAPESPLAAVPAAASIGIHYASENLASVSVGTSSAGAASDDAGSGGGVEVQPSSAPAAAATPSSAEERAAKVRHAEARVRQVMDLQGETCRQLRATLEDLLASVARGCGDPTSAEQAKAGVLEALRGGESKKAATEMLRAVDAGLLCGDAQVTELLGRLQREEELEGFWQCLGSALAEGDRLQIDFWYEEAEREQLKVPLEVGEALEALKGEEEAKLAHWQYSKQFEEAVADCYERQDAEALRELVLDAMERGEDPSAASAALAALSGGIVAGGAHRSGLGARRGGFAGGLGEEHFWEEGFEEDFAGAFGGGRRRRGLRRKLGRGTRRAGGLKGRRILGFDQDFDEDFEDFDGGGAGLDEAFDEELYQDVVGSDGLRGGCNSGGFEGLGRRSSAGLDDDVERLEELFSGRPLRRRRRTGGLGGSAGLGGLGAADGEAVDARPRPTSELPPSAFALFEGPGITLTPTAMATAQAALADGGLDDDAYYHPPAELDNPHVRAVMYISITNGQSHCFGMYRLVPGELANGMPLYRQLGGERWLYSDNVGRWTIGGARARELNFQNSSGFVYCREKHKGSLPDEVGQGKWLRHDDAAKKWCLDEEITVSSEFLGEVYDGRRRKGREKKPKEPKQSAKGKQKGKDAVAKAQAKRPSRVRSAKDLYVTMSRPMPEAPPPQPPPGSVPPSAARPPASAPAEQAAPPAPAAVPAATPPPPPQCSPEPSPPPRPPYDQGRPLPRRRRGPLPTVPPGALVAVGMSRARALEILGFTSGPGTLPPSPPEIRRAYRRAAMRWHPDRRQNHGREEEAKRNFQDLRDAFELLQSDMPPGL